MSDMACTLWQNQILRFWNHEITRERRAVLDTILTALEGRIFQRNDILSLLSCDRSFRGCENVMHLNQAPSSDPSGHLLPAGEKREQAARALPVRTVAPESALLERMMGSTAKRRSPSSPQRGQGGPKGWMRGSSRHTPKVARSIPDD
ncbi:hypothetical protein NXC14_CH03287 [Rhizobium sp. NXC14]|nr:hypothetical protein NXC14_CH03287 [Rhizobium sp. NXC14]